MRPPIATALLARFRGVLVSGTIVLGVIVLATIVRSPSFSLAQEPPDVTRKIVSKEVTVAPNGKAKFTQVVGGSPVLAKAAVDAIEKWKWATGPQETKELIELNFHP
jgi:hypothetical protein